MIHGMTSVKEPDNPDNMTKFAIGSTCQPAPTVSAQGEPQPRRSLMQPAQWIRDMHPFMTTLVEWATGVPVDCGVPWPMEAIDLAVARGPHRSALTTEARTLIVEEVDYQVKAGFTEVMDWETVKQLAPKNLKVSPLAVIPQVNRRGRLLLDLSFPVHKFPTTRPRKRVRQTDGLLIQPAVNATTTSMSPAPPVKELGRVLLRLFDFLASVPPHEIVHLAKIDLSDGFWRMLVEEEDKWNFAYVLPGAPNAPVRLVIPHALQMGWTESPGYFCAATETGRDVMQSLLEAGIALPPHCADKYMTPAFPAKRQTVQAPEWKMMAVYVDDYILAAVQSADGTLLQRMGRAALHTIHAIFPPPATSGHEGGKDPISQKKLEANDARWAPEKTILGFVIDGATRTVRLPDSKAADLAMTTRRLLAKKRVPLKTFQSVVGRLRNAATILPAARSLFTPLNRALRGNPVVVILGPANSELRATLLDLRTMVLDLARRPTHVNELVHRPPGYLGYCDASAFGAGGVWFSGACSLTPQVWRIVWPLDIQSAVVSSSNPEGRLTNSDLEMAAVLLHFNVLETCVPTLQHVNTVIHSDNSPSVAWATTMATKTAKSEAAHRLLRGLAMRQRSLEAGPLLVVHIAGKSNTLADIASRPIPDLADDSHFLTHFATRFPLSPKRTSWQRALPMPEQMSNVILTLRGQRLQLPRWTMLPARPAGGGGHVTAMNATSTPGCPPAPLEFNNNCSWALPPGLELDSLGLVGRLVPKPSKKPSVTWHRPACWLDLTTLDEPPVATTSTCPLPTS